MLVKEAPGVIKAHACYIAMKYRCEIQLVRKMDFPFDNHYCKKIVFILTHTCSNLSSIRKCQVRFFLLTDVLRMCQKRCEMYHLSSPYVMN